MGSEEKAELLLSVVDAVHDYLDDDISQGALEEILETAFIEGGNGVWESTGDWLLKLCERSASFQILWLNLARHSRFNVRFRVACHLNDIPQPARFEISELLVKDKSKKVREMAKDRIAFNH